MIGDWWGWDEPRPVDLIYTINQILYLIIIAIGMFLVELRTHAETRTPQEHQALERSTIRALLWTILIALLSTALQVVLMNE